jgi:hypothetical protein
LIKEEKMKKLIVLIGLILSTSLFAGNPLRSVKILHFSVDISESYGEIHAFYKENGDIDHLEWRIEHPQDPDEPGEQDKFSVKDIQEGTVFKKGLPKKFVKVWGENFSAHNGGEINVRVPHNIITGKHTFEKFTVDRLGDTWEVNHSTRDQVTKVELLLKRFLGLPIGITGFKILD